MLKKFKFVAVASSALALVAGATATGVVLGVSQPDAQSAANTGLRLQAIKKEAVQSSLQN